MVAAPRRNRQTPASSKASTRPPTLSNAWKWTAGTSVIIDGPPAFLQIVSEMVDVADFTLIPCKPSMLDILAMQDVISFARDAKSAHLVVLNDVPSAKFAETSRSLLTAQRVPVAKTQVSHRPSHIAALAAGKTAAEINGGRDKLAASEIEALWLEVKAAATKAAKARRKEEAGP